MSASFQVGTTYSTTLASDHTAEVWWTVVARVGTMLTLEDKRGALKQRRAIASGAGEICFPDGRSAGIMLDSTKSE